MKKILIPFVTLFSINAFAAVVSQGNSAQAYNIAETFTSLSDWWWILVFLKIRKIRGGASFFVYPFIRDLCLNRNNHQKPTFHPLGDF
ncbi:hypothetical protein BSPWISOXPB_6390 [uncultured Gammaproteobacteria bacterium]|nr:hypothetical protein BSPWISOXPB_6390 [uncultured Gammaproteobacteria bacterium]